MINWQWADENDNFAWINCPIDIDLTEQKLKKASELSEAPKFDLSDWNQTKIESIDKIHSFSGVDFRIHFQFQPHLFYSLLNKSQTQTLGSMACVLAWPDGISAIGNFFPHEIIENSQSDMCSCKFICYSDTYLHFT